MFSVIGPIAAAALVLCLHLTGALTSLADHLTELRFSLTERAPTGSILLVEIDARSLREVGVWPWPRSIHADIADRLNELGAAEIAFDIDFSTRSTAEADLALVKALERAGGSVILAAFQQKSGSGDGAHVAVNRPIPEFEAHSWQALVNVQIDHDGDVRRFPYGGVVDGRVLPSMPAMLAGHPGPFVGDFLIDFAIDSTSLSRVSAVDLLRGEVRPELVSGRKVIIGAAAVELRDIFHVPVHGLISGPTLQALGTESLLQNRALQPLSPAWPLGVCLGLLSLTVAMRRARWPYVIASLASASLLGEGAAFWLQSRFPLVPDTSLIHAAVIALAAARIIGEIDVRRILIAIARTETANTRTILSRVISDNFAGIIVVNEDRLVEVASRSAAEILHLDAEDELVGRCHAGLLPAPFSQVLEAAISACRNGQPVPTETGEIGLDLGAEGERILEYVVRPSQLEGGTDRAGRRQAARFVATLTFSDVTERRRSQARLAHLARFDTLTDLPNRNQVIERLTIILKDPLKRSASAIFFFDLDRFKNVNDTLGHDYGDLLLRAVSERVQTLVAPEDLVARFGGDEYAIIRAQRADAEEFAARLIRTLSEPYQLKEHRMIIGASVGIALPSAVVTPAVVLKQADTALYRAKAAGGAAYRIYDESMDAGLRERQELEVDLWEAFDSNQFEVHYQPQVDLASGVVTGVEALVRWRHPFRGYVSPADFIPVAEAVGLIEALGAHVLRAACADAMTWERPIKIGVNVSPVQFSRGDLLKTVESVLEETGLSPERLDLEITESLFVSENPIIRHTIDVLRERGVTFSIDDFGTGYSSLSYVSKFPIQKIKIDQSFVRKLPFDREAAAIVRAVASLAVSLDIRANAEGIETEEQATFLRLLGVKEGQGYLFGRPQPNPAISSLLRSQASDANGLEPVMRAQ